MLFEDGMIVTLDREATVLRVRPTAEVGLGSGLGLEEVYHLPGSQGLAPSGKREKLPKAVRERMKYLARFLQALADQGGSSK